MSSSMLVNRRSPAMPEGVEVAWYKSYEDASKAVEHLSANDFPIDKVTIVGSGLHTVEQVLGRLTPARVAMTGATQGLTWGMLMALMSFIIIPDASPLVPLAAIVFGVLAGMTIVSATWGFSKKKRMFASRNHMVASRYALLVSESQDKAFELLKDSKGNQMRARKKPTRLIKDEERLGGPPTEYGSRPDERPRFGVRLENGQKTNGEAQSQQSKEEPKAGVPEKVDLENPFASSATPRRGERDQDGRREERQQHDETDQRDEEA